MNAINLTYASLFALALFMSALVAVTPAAQAASDTDVLNIEATKVIIKEEKIVVTGKAEIRMLVFTPENDDAVAEAEFLGRSATWVVVAADRATFTVRRPEEGKSDWWTKMSVDAAKTLKRGKRIGRIGFYRPLITLKENAIHSVSGYGYIYPLRDSSD